MLLLPDIVFTTLSSSGLQVLQTPSGREDDVEMKARRCAVVCIYAGVVVISLRKCTGFSFDLIIVDEAAQSVELSTLIPLRFNCKKMILVGLCCCELHFLFHFL